MTAETTADRPGGLIVVGCDGSDAAQPALDFAVREAVLRGCRLVVVTAFVNPYRQMAGFSAPELDARLAADSTEGVQIAVDRALAGAGATQLRCELRALEGRPAAVLLAEGADAELIVVGARGTGGWGRLRLGSTSTEVVHHAEIPVVVVHTPTDDAPRP